MNVFQPNREFDAAVLQETEVVQRKPLSPPAQPSFRRPELPQPKSIKPPLTLSSIDSAAEPQHDALLPHAIDALDWNDLKIFRKVVAAGSFRAAAVELKTAINTVRTRVARLEENLKAALLLRDHEGVQLTQTGVRLNRMVQSMMEAAGDLGAIDTDSLRTPGELKIGSTEGLCAGWLTPLLPSLFKRVPGYRVSLVMNEDHHINDSGELDIGISWGMPENDRLNTRRVGTIHFMLFGSPDYIARRGMPTSGEELLQHAFIDQIAMGSTRNMLEYVVGSRRPQEFVTLSTNSTSAIMWSVANGTGLAFLPTYAMAVCPHLVPIDIKSQMKRDIFYYYHPEARSSEVVQAGLSWVRQCFDETKYPWFRSEYVDPRECVQSVDMSPYRTFGSMIAGRPVQGDLFD